MADSSLSSDLEHETSPPRPPKTKAKAKTRSTSSSRPIPQPKASVASDKDSLRRHNALERQFKKAKQAASSSLGLEAQPLQQAPLVQGSDDVTPLVTHTQRPSTLANSFGSSDYSLARSRGVSLSMPNVSAVGFPPSAAPQQKQPEATFTPTGAPRRGGSPAREPTGPISDVVYCPIIFVGGDSADNPAT